VTISVVIAEDQTMVRAGLVMLLTAEPDIEVVGEADDGSAAIELTRAKRPDIVLMDPRMPGMDGVTATRALVDAEQESHGHLTKVLVLTTFDDDEYVYGALRAGASGYLLKHAAPQDLIVAVRRVASGDAWIDPAVAGRVIAALAASDPHQRNQPELLERLTPREREVLVLMARGLSNAEIRDQLVVSPDAEV
jgi:DNA-binding NarL/FixJ family response regulator